MKGYGYQGRKEIKRQPFGPAGEKSQLQKQYREQPEEEHQGISARLLRIPDMQRVDGQQQPSQQSRSCVPPPAIDDSNEHGHRKGARQRRQQSRHPFDVTVALRQEQSQYQEIGRQRVAHLGAVVINLDKWNFGRKHRIDLIHPERLVGQAVKAQAESKESQDQHQQSRSPAEQGERMRGCHADSLAVVSNLWVVRRQQVNNKFLKNPIKSWSEQQRGGSPPSRVRGPDRHHQRKVPKLQNSFSKI